MIETKEDMSECNAWDVKSLEWNLNGMNMNLKD